MVPWFPAIVAGVVSGSLRGGLPSEPGPGWGVTPFSVFAA